MPRKYNRRRFKKRRNQRRRNYRMTLKRSPVSQRMFTKFRYSTTISLNPTVGGAVAEHVFSATGLYDPDISGVGHQPRGFDQLIGVLYDHYVVVGSRLTARFDNSANADPILGMVKCQDSSQTTVLRTDWQEDHYVARRAISGSNGTAMGTVSKKVGTKRFLGRRNVMSDPDLKGNNLSNPTENIFWHVGVCTLDDSLDASAIPVQIDIEYLAVLIEPRNPAQS